MRRYHLSALALLLCSSMLIAGCDSGEEEPDINDINGTWEADPEGPGDDSEAYVIISGDQLTFIDLNEFETPDCWEQTGYTLTHEEGLNYVLTRAGRAPIDVRIFREDNVLTISGEFGGAAAYVLADNTPDFDPECD